MKDYLEEEWNFIKEFNNTKVDYPSNETVHAFFEKQAELTPNHIAVIAGKGSLTYRELNEKANQLARLLRKKGVGKNQLVAIMVERSIEMIVGIFAILKAGGAYLPLSSEYPDKRIEYMITDSHIEIVVTQEKFIPKCSVYPVDVMNLNASSLYAESGENLSNINAPHDLIYVIYTSGSTGKPKGVMVEHTSVVNRLLWMQERYPIDENDTILQKTPFVFDVSVWEIFWWSMVGSKVCFLAPGNEKFPQAIIEEVEKNEITVMHFVPSMLNVFLHYIDNSKEANRIKSLKQVFASGEALMVSCVKKFRRILYHENKTKLTNLYGPTEATVDVTYFDCPMESDLDKVLIGKPIHNTRIYIMENNKMQPIGNIGELCIAGVGLARGYFNNNALTDEKFVDNPLEKGSKMYRTGDLARWDADGNIEFLCRMDNQVKIRGLRIELEEIENVIMEYGSIEHCLVIVKGKESVNPRITAYIVAKHDVDYTKLKQYLKNILPSYMIPSVFITIDSIPFTTNGKVNREQLENIDVFKSK